MSNSSIFYLLVGQETPHIERYRRRGHHEWVMTEVARLDETIGLESIGCVLTLRGVYDGVF